MGTWVTYHDRLLAQSKVTPTYFVTYEQLIIDPTRTLKDMFCFLYDVKSVSGTLLEDRIDKICNQGHKGHEVYKLKEGTGKLYRQAF